MAVKVFRVLGIPALGFLAAWVTMRWASRRGSPLGDVSGSRARRILTSLMVIGFVVMAGLLWARYATWHSFVFDLGFYDQKVWFISQQANWWAMLQQTWKGGVEISPCGIARFWGICHLQPLYLVPGLIYQAWASPLVLLVFQVLVVVSGVIPVYLLACDYLGTAGAGVLSAVLYLVYPAVQFNGMVDFRPDHLAIVALLWSFLLAGRDRPLAALGVAVAVGVVKETLLLSFAFFGLYLWIQYRRWMLGLVSFGLGGLLFYLVTFHLLASERMSEGHFFLSNFFPALSGTGGSWALPRFLRNPLAIIETVDWPLKLIYFAELLGPLAFLPLLSPSALIPAIPSLAVSWLSALSTHASIQSQYTASVIGPMFVALFGSLRWLGRRFGQRVAPVPILAGLVVLSAFASFALGPTPLSIKFWSRTVSGHWHYSQYLPDRQQVLNRAASLIPTDPRIVVVTQNDLNSAGLAHRNAYYTFPVEVDRADYIFLDRWRMPFVYWYVDLESYRRTISELVRDPAFEVLFDQEGVLLLKRRTTQEPSGGRARDQAVKGQVPPANGSGTS